MSVHVLSAANGTIDLRPFLNLPAGIPPPGVKANFIDPPRYVLDLVVTTTLVTVIMLLLLVARTCCLARVRHAIGLEDVACYIGALGVIATYVSGIYTCTVGYFGYPQYDLKVWQMVSDANLRGLLIFTWGSTISLIFVKASFFIMFWKIFGQLRWVRLSLLIGGISVTLFNLATGIAIVYADTPSPGESWLQHLTSPLEGMITNLAIAMGAVALASDIFILVLPLVAVWGLHMPRQRKWAIVPVFLAGVLACVASAIALYTRPRVTNSTNAPTDLKNVIMCGVIEYSIGVCCSCAPSVSQLLRTTSAFPKLAKYLCCGGGRASRGNHEEDQHSNNASTTAATTDQQQGAMPSRWDWFLPRSVRHMQSGKSWADSSNDNTTFVMDKTDATGSMPAITTHPIAL